MSRRFFAPEATPNNELSLQGDQAHHIHNVMRFKPGEQVVLFNGSGLEFNAEIVTASKKAIQLRVGPAIKSESESTVDLTIAVCLPKGDRQKFLIEKLVELGATKLVPLKTERSVSEAPPKVIARIEKQVVEACKQCERNQLMQVGPVQSLSSLGAELESASDTKLYIATPGSERDLACEPIELGDHVVVAIGPEGGFSNDEQNAAAEQGWTPIRLAHNILRIETAAIAATVIATNVATNHREDR